MSDIERIPEVRAYFDDSWEDFREAEALLRHIFDDGEPSLPVDRTPTTDELLAESY